MTMTTALPLVVVVDEGAVRIRCAVKGCAFSCPMWIKESVATLFAEAVQHAQAHESGLLVTVRISTDGETSQDAPESVTVAVEYPPADPGQQNNANPARGEELAQSGVLAPRAVCQVCHLTLDVVIDEDGGHYRHTLMDSAADHDPVPVLGLAARGGRCDFCAEDTSTHAIPARDFTVPGLPDQYSRGAWSACMPCLLLIESNRWTALARRGIEAFARVHGLPMTEGGQSMLRMLHRRLRANITGTAIPLPEAPPEAAAPGPISAGDAVALLGRLPADTPVIAYDPRTQWYANVALDSEDIALALTEDDGHAVVLTLSEYDSRQW